MNANQKSIPQATVTANMSVFQFQYSVCMAGLAAAKIYIDVVLFNALTNIRETVQGWVTDAFNVNFLQPFNVLEVTVRRKEYFR